MRYVGFQERNYYSRDTASEFSEGILVNWDPERWIRILTIAHNFEVYWFGTAVIGFSETYLWIKANILHCWLKHTWKTFSFNLQSRFYAYLSYITHTIHHSMRRSCSWASTWLPHYTTCIYYHYHYFHYYYCYYLLSLLLIIIIYTYMHYTYIWSYIYWYSPLVLYNLQTNPPWTILPDQDLGVPST